MRHEGAARASVARYYPGRDLNEVFTGGMTADECWGFLMHLPRDSPLMAALAADPDYASDAKPGPVPWTEFGPEVQALAAVHDLLGSLVSMVGSLGGKPPQIAPYPRPVSPAQRRRREEQRAKHEWLKARLLPEGG